MWDEQGPHLTLPLGLQTSYQHEGRVTRRPIWEEPGAALSPPGLSPAQCARGPAQPRLSPPVAGWRGVRAGADPLRRAGARHSQAGSADHAARLRPCGRRTGGTELT